MEFVLFILLAVIVGLAVQAIVYIMRDGWDSYKTLMLEVLEEHFPRTPYQ